MDYESSSNVIITVLTLCIFGLTSVSVNQKDKDISYTQDIKIDNFDSDHKLIQVKYEPPVNLSTPVVFTDKIKSYDLRQIECLAKNIYFEARNQSIEGQSAVAFVTFNRAKSSKFPGSLCKVVYQGKKIKTEQGHEYVKNKCAFSWVCDGKSDRIKNKIAWENSYSIAYDLYINNKKIKDPTYGSTHYYAKYINPPRWAKKMIETTKIGAHIFYKENNG